MIFHDFTYNQLASHILTNGTFREDRTGVGTVAEFGCRMEFNLRQGFPLLTGKKIPFRAIAWELIWFMEGRTDVAWLNDRKVTIWDEWKKPDGTIGPGYGKLWRDFGGVDQLQDVVERIKTKPHDRRLVVSAWNPGELSDMALPPCHLLYQFFVDNGRLSLQMYQRSADMFLGVPFNIASYSLLIHIVAHLCGLQVGRFIWIGGDCHFYLNHVDQIDEQLRRSYRVSPTLQIRHHAPDEIFGWCPNDFELIGYNPHPSIKAPVAV